MLKMKTKSLNLSAVSMVEMQGESGAPVLVMTGTISTNGELTTGTSVKNYQLYDKYMDEVETDHTEFRRWLKSEKDRMDAEKESGD